MAIVETAQGRIQGTRSRGLDSFRGIPFAAPPLGPLRFAAPQPPAPWSGIRPADRFGPAAPQQPLRFDLIPGMDVGGTDEDCLRLNVFTPSIDPAARRPVLVWIHGGAFSIGSASQAMYDPRALVSRGDVVVVSINYRLGALGFLALGESGSVSNAGLLDQLAALRWVRENVREFGGDPDNVTVFGESAGGMSVGCLLGMPEARGLFRRAIAMSGAAHSVMDAETATRVAVDLQRELGQRGGSALRALPVEEILAAQSRCEARYADAFARLGFRPSIDGESLPARPIDTIRAGLSRDVSLLVGTTRDEWKLFGFMDPAAAELQDDSLLARIEARVPGRAGELLDAYRKANPSAAAPDLYFAIETDRLFRIPAIRLAEAQAAHQRRTWAYLFTWESPMMAGALGACHGIDVPFVFGRVETDGAEVFAGGGPDAIDLSGRTMDAWLRFARTGDPGHAALPVWLPYGRDRRTMLLGASCSLRCDPQGAERVAWDGIL